MLPTLLLLEDRLKVSREQSFCLYSFMDTVLFLCKYLSRGEAQEGPGQAQGGPKKAPWLPKGGPRSRPNFRKSLKIVGNMCKMGPV